MVILKMKRNIMAASRVATVVSLMLLGRRISSNLDALKEEESAVLGSPLPTIICKKKYIGTLARSMMTRAIGKLKLTKRAAMTSLMIVLELL